MVYEIDMSSKSGFKELAQIGKSEDTEMLNIVYHWLINPKRNDWYLMFYTTLRIWEVIYLDETLYMKFIVWEDWKNDKNGEDIKLSRTI